MQGTPGFSSDFPLGRRRFIQGAASFGLGAVALAACGSDDADEAAESVTTDAATTEEPVTTPRV